MVNKRIAIAEIKDWLSAEPRATIYHLNRPI